MKKWMMLSLALAFASVQADPPQLETDILPAGAGSDLLDPATATNLAALVVNIGQLAGMDLEGVDLTDPADLLPLVAQSLLIRSSEGAVILLDHDGVHAVNVTAGGFSFVDGQGQPTGQVTSWEELIELVDWQSISNLPPQQPVTSEHITEGSVTVDSLDFDPHAAAGPEGAIQYSSSGQLAGDAQFAVDSVSGKVDITASGTDMIRAYWDEDAGAEDVVFLLRRRPDATAEVVLFQNGEETIRLQGNGSAYIPGQVNLGTVIAETLELSQGAWYVPEGGDLMMGSFTAPGTPE